MDTEELTTAELSRKLGVCDATVQRWCRNGRVPGAYLGIRHGRLTWLIPGQIADSLRLRYLRRERGLVLKQDEQDGQ